MKIRKMLTVMASILLAVALVACSSSIAGSAVTTATQSSSAATGTSATTKAVQAASGTVKFGVVAAMTGTNTMIGTQVANGARLAAEEINANGGILGKKLELVFEDEIDNQQASVNAMTKMMEYKDLIAFYGSTASGNCIAVSSVVKEKQIPMLAGGSSANIPKQNNPYMWQARMTDDQTGKVLAEFAAKTLKLKNPAILYSTESFGTGLKDQTVAALEKLGVSVSEKRIIGYNVEEKNYSPLISLIQNSGADGLIAIAQQQPAILIVNQIANAGLDMPLLGSASFSCDLVFTNCKQAADGWYSVCEWVPTTKSEKGQQLVKLYRERYKANTDAPSAYTYDSVLLFAEACRLANTTTDKEAINNAFKSIKDFKGAMTTYSFADNHSFATTLIVTQNKNQTPEVITDLKVR